MQARVFGMAEEPKKPGRKPKRAREDPSTPVFAAVASGSAMRTKPTVIVKIHSFKEASEVRRLTCPPRMLGADECTARFLPCRFSTVDYVRRERAGGAPRPASLRAV